MVHGSEYFISRWQHELCFCRKWSCWLRMIINQGCITGYLFWVMVTAEKLCPFQGPGITTIEFWLYQLAALPWINLCSWGGIPQGIPPVNVDGTPISRSLEPRGRRRLHPVRPSNQSPDVAGCVTEHSVGDVGQFMVHPWGPHYNESTDHDSRPLL